MYRQVQWCSSGTPNSSKDEVQISGLLYSGGVFFFGGDKSLIEMPKEN
jgi:hypothetical protein